MPQPLTRGQRGYLLASLTLANVVNFYDRTIPAVIVEPLKEEFGLTDTMVGVLGGSFTVVYAIAGVLLGRLADRVPRRYVMAAGLVVWSLFTGASGLVQGFLFLFLFRLGVGIGEASYGPASNALICDVYAPKRRSRAISIVSLGIPVGLLLAFLTVGVLVEATGTWRAPFVIAAVPGLLLAIAVLFVKEPARGATDTVELRAQEQERHPYRAVLRIRTITWLMVAGIGLQIPTYGVATFVVPLLQRYFGLSIGSASIGAGAILGLAGIVGLLLGGRLADRASDRHPAGRLVVAAAGFAAAIPLTLAALLLGPGSAAAFVALFAVGWTGTQFLSAAASPAIADVTPPQLRATAIAVYFASFNLVGATIGPILVGALSDGLATPVDGLAADAVGLHRALLTVIPIGLAIAVLGAWRASRALPHDREAMTPFETARPSPPQGPGPVTPAA
ncbi:MULTISPECIES: spinster family MFS transporter [Janibacter]|uniref:spinster family MFS transporter n=1 Tax=Janibacter TaxID=53457 RepID=UPI0021A27342|nr:MFS transporter [Janibacter hoylei]MCT1618411.1 MFS transporter [Janibacter hoylei]MCT2292566.1 MFS transporter [Janibacter hoylei]MCW4601593.1 MFS transporter [Janibacter hoylei]